MKHSKNFTVSINLNIIQIFLIIFCKQNGDLSENNIIYLGLIILSLIGIICNGIKRHFLVYTQWLLCFILIFSLSIDWSIDRELTISSLIGTLARGILIAYISLYMTSWKRVFNVINTYIIVCLILNIYIYLFKGLNYVAELREVIGNTGSWNSNMIGMVFALSIFFCIIVMRFGRGRYSIFSNKIYFLIILNNALIVFVSASKKAILMLIILNVGYFALSRKRKKLIGIILAVMMIPLIYILITRVSVLYNMFGYRIEEYVLGVLGYQKYTISDNTRMFLIRLGVERFLERPYLGYGMATFKNLYLMAGGTKALYAHNNYIELMIGIGFIGTLTYYSIHLYVLKNIIKIENGEKRGLVFVLLIMILIIDYGLVSYAEIPFMLIIAIMTAVIQIEKEQQNILKRNT